MQILVPLPKKGTNKICNKFGSCPERPSKIFTPARDNDAILFTVQRFIILFPPPLMLQYEHVCMC